MKSSCWAEEKLNATGGYDRLSDERASDSEKEREREEDTKSEHSILGCCGDKGRERAQR